jgi:hypothetical protein
MQFPPIQMFAQAVHTDTKVVLTGTSITEMQHSNATTQCLQMRIFRMNISSSYTTC